MHSKRKKSSSSEARRAGATLQQTHIHIPHTRLKRDTLTIRIYTCRVGVWWAICVAKLCAITVPAFNYYLVKRTTHHTYTVANTIMYNHRLTNLALNQIWNQFVNPLEDYSQNRSFDKAHWFLRNCNLRFMYINNFETILFNIFEIPPIKSTNKLLFIILFFTYIVIYANHLLYNKWFYYLTETRDDTTFWKLINDESLSISCGSFTLFNLSESKRYHNN